jgi:signal transduction histidine kinase
LLTVALSSRLQRIISDPILGLADTAKTIAARKDYSARATKVGEDEVGNLTDAFNQMLAQIQGQDSALQKAHGELEKRVKALQHEITERQRAEEELEVAHRRLLEASRQAGMAEVATGVLHNVGNVLNSVNVSTTLLRDQVRKSEIATVVRLAGLLREHRDDLANFIATDPKGRMIPQFLATLGEHLAAERDGMVKELELLAKNVEHIKDIVSMQQSYASVAGFIERVNAEEMMEDALQFNAAALTRHGVEVIRQYEPVPSFMADKHKVLQILVNLIANAKYALQESGRVDKRLTVGIRLNGERGVQVIVQDNGVGIPPENLTRIFAHGFTTRTKGHGFGLHSSALAAQEMGGDLKARSEGSEQGATFVLELPLPVKGSS